MLKYATPFLTGRRTLWSWLNIVWNRVDKERIKEVGPEKACAEWLMRNGALVRWKGESDYTVDYDRLESISGQHILEIDATDSSINHIGFDHFIGCNNIQKIKMHQCMGIDDLALKKLGIVKQSLTDLHVSSCGNVTDSGIKSLVQLMNLKYLILQDLIGVKNPSTCMTTLKSGLPSCNISYSDASSKSSPGDKPASEADTQSFM